MKVVKTRLVAVTVLVMGAAAMAAYVRATVAQNKSESSPEASARSFLNALWSAQYDKAYTALSQDIRSVVSLSQFQAFQDKSGYCSRHIWPGSKIVGSVLSEGGDRAVIQLKAPGTPLTGTIVLERRENNWCVVSLSPTVPAVELKDDAVTKLIRSFWRAYYDCDYDRMYECMSHGPGSLSKEEWVRKLQKSNRREVPLSVLKVYKDVEDGQYMLLYVLATMKRGDEEDFASAEDYRNYVDGQLNILPSIVKNEDGRWRIVLGDEIKPFLIKIGKIRPRH